MGQKTGGAEAVHEVLVHIHFQVGDGFGDGLHFFQQAAVQEQFGGPLQRGIAQRDKALPGQVRQEPDGDGPFRVDVVAEGPGNIKPFDVVQGVPHRLHQRSQDGVHGRLGPEQDIQIHLGENQGLPGPGFFGRRQQVGRPVLHPNPACGGNIQVELPLDIDQIG